MPECWIVKVHFGRRGKGEISVGANVLNSWCLAQSDGNHFVVPYSIIWWILHLIKPAELQSAAQWLFYLPFQSLRALLWSTFNACSCRSFLFFCPDILFLSAQLVNMMSNLPRTTSNSNDVGRNTDALTTLLICFPGSKTPPLLMENLTCSICVFIHVQLIFWALSDIYPVRWRTAKVTEIAPWSNCTALW